MRKVVFGCANSLDNFIARSDHAVDWLVWSDDVSTFIETFWKTIDTVVMGRKTYEVGLKGGAPVYPGVANYVFSRTMTTATAGVTLISEDPATFLRRLKTQPGKDICVMGGGELGRSLLDGDVIDELGVNIHPLLLGTGVPLFHELRQQVDLELLECRQFQGGCVLLRYAVKHGAPSTAG